jgi:hypothetical protein
LTHPSPHASAATTSPTTTTHPYTSASARNSEKLTSTTDTTQSPTPPPAKPIQSASSLSQSTTNRASHARGLMGSSTSTKAPTNQTSRSGSQTPLLICASATHRACSSRKQKSQSTTSMMRSQPAKDAHSERLPWKPTAPWAKNSWSTSTTSPIMQQSTTPTLPSALLQQHSSVASPQKSQQR